jgi:hypothetical protein
MVAKIIVAVVCVDWLTAQDSYGHLAAKFVVAAIS